MHVSIGLRFLMVLAALAAFAAAPAAAKTRAPDWLTAIASGSKAAGENAAIVLLDESAAEVTKDGIFHQRLRKAIRVVTREGQQTAVASVTYDSGSDKVRSLKAWVLRPDGQVVALAGNRIVDAAVYGTALELYGENRQQILSAVEDAVPGSIFGYEAQLEVKPFVAQEIWHFSSRYPAEQSSYSLTVPAGWQVEARTFNHTEIEPTVQGHTRTWTLRKLPALEPEPFAPTALTHGPWLAVDLKPPRPLAAKDRMKTFGSWAEISAYFAARYSEVCSTDESIKAKVGELTAGKNSRWERIHALCRYAQKVNYISLTLNASTGGGMVPRPAPRVFKCNYGDCKDKANLLSAMLQELGVTSYPLAVFSGDPTHVQEIWPSAIQFNHCILAIKVDDSFEAAAVVAHPALGRLLIFDPTNTYTPPGLLSEETAGGQALLMATEHGGLFRLPVLPEDGNRIERTIRAKLGKWGALQGTIEERFFRHASADARGQYLSESPSEYRKTIESWLSATLATPKASRVEAKDFFDDARFDLSIDFQSPSYGMAMRDELLTFKPVVVNRRTTSALKKKERVQPIVIEPLSLQERAEIELPLGFVIDDEFAGVQLETDFGSYRAKGAAQDGVFVFERSLKLKSSNIPAAQYEKVRTFFDRIVKAEQSSVVLKRASNVSP